MTLPSKRAFVGDDSYSKETAPKHPRIEENHEEYLDSTAGAKYQTVEEVSEPHDAYAIV
jgi:hypothetical protein